jgi:hypothetical protein
MKFKRKERKNIWRSLFLIALVGLFSACLRPASNSVVDLSRFTPQAGTTPGAESPEPTFPAGTQIPEQTSVLPDVSPTLSRTLNPATETTLSLFPLHQGSAWVYEYLGFDSGEEVIWQVVETVVDTGFREGYFVAQVERAVVLMDGDPPDDFLMAPDTETFWYLVDGEEVYQFSSMQEVDLSAAWLALILPFPEEGEAWYPNPEQRTGLDPGFLGARFASAPFEKVLPTGHSHTCYNIATRYNEGVEEMTFCEQVGIVFGESKYTEENYGFRFELLAFSLQ